MTRHKRILVVPVLLVLILLAGCQGGSFLRDANRTLAVSYSLRDTVLKGAGDLWREGKIDNDVRDEFIRVGDLYKDAHNTALDAVQAYARTKATDDENKAQVAILEFNAVLSELLQLAMKYAIDTGG